MGVDRYDVRYRTSISYDDVFKSVKDIAAIAAFCAGLNAAPPRRR